MIVLTMEDTVFMVLFNVFVCVVYHGVVMDLMSRNDLNIKVAIFTRIIDVSLVHV